MAGRASDVSLRWALTIAVSMDATATTTPEPAAPTRELLSLCVAALGVVDSAPPLHPAAVINKLEHRSKQKGICFIKTFGNIRDG